MEGAVDAEDYPPLTSGTHAACTSQGARISGFHARVGWCACSLGVDENTEILVPRCGHQLESEEGTTHAIFEILKACPPHSTTPDPVPGTPSDSGFCTQRGVGPATALPIL